MSRQVGDWLWGGASECPYTAPLLGAGLARTLSGMADAAAPAADAGADAHVGPAPALQLEPTTAECPLRAVEVPVGDRVCFSTRSKGQTEFRWTAERLPTWGFTEYVEKSEGQAYRGWTNVEVMRRLFRGGQEVVGSRLRLKPTVGLDRSRQPRLRVYIDAQYYQLSDVVAFCWNRPSLSHLSWRDFTAGLGQGKKSLYEADHLPFVTPDGGLATRVDTCGAGWVEAITKAEHNKRTLHLREACRVFQDALELEREQAAWAPLLLRAVQGAPEKRTLADLGHGGAGPTAARTLELLRSGIEFAEATHPFCRLTWDIQWQTGDDLDDNAFEHQLFVQAHWSDPAAAPVGLDEGGLVQRGVGPEPKRQKRVALTPRQALIAHLIRESRLQRAAALREYAQLRGAE